MLHGAAPRSIPVLNPDLTAHREMYHALHLALSRAQRVTVVCGAGISTSAGIPDYRSEGGLYNTQPSELGTDVSSQDLFDIRNLRSAETLGAVGRMMARLRITARDAAPTEGHLYIKELHRAKRLLRCYTQNVDGIQTRGHPDMSDYVLELHGRNELRCHRCKMPPEGNLRELDHRVLSEGLAWCSRCVDRGEAGLPLEERRLRPLPPGCLLPDVVWNQDSRDHSIGGQSLEQLQEKDGLADLLLVIGTSIGTQGVARLVRSLATNVHRRKGAVVYIGKGAPSTVGWGEHIDLRLDSDIDRWAANASRLLAAVSVRPGGAPPSLTLPREPMPMSRVARTSRPLVDIADLVRTLSEEVPSGGAGVSLEDVERLPTRRRESLMLLVCHSGAGKLLAERLALAVARWSERHGWTVRALLKTKALAPVDSPSLQCRCYEVQLSGSQDLSPQVPNCDRSAKSTATHERS
ncbi:hypothetical protein FRC10_009031 [Ceratobasidium sp. 414]|nr:hypothetical protein FRC10_009031 [Ceratobasidium sp. 414]